MKVPWDDLRQAEARHDARREALDVVRRVLGTLSDRLERHSVIMYRKDTRIALTIMKNEIQKIVKEIDKELGKPAPAKRDTSGRYAAVSGPDEGPVDILPGACGDTSCTQAHGVSGRHTGELGGHR